jgi:arylsulfatase A-like enzyme
MNRRKFLKWTGTLSLAPLFSRCSVAPKEEIERPDPRSRKPNIVLFYTDDMGYSDLGCYGCRDISTPHLDALAASGIRLTHFYTAAPVCGPSRAALLTGKSPQAAGVPTNFRGAPNVTGLKGGEFTIAELLKSGGYVTGLFGKWHLGTAAESLPNAQGFDEFFGHLNGCVHFFDHMYVWNSSIGPFHDLWRNKKEVREDGAYMTDLITRETLSFIDKHREQPFFAYVAYNAPHYPMEAPDRWLRPYDHLEPNRKPYAAMVACLDDSIGQIVGRIRALGLEENTLFIFTNDNGPSDESRTKVERGRMPGSSRPFRGVKFSLYEGGIRSPFIAAWKSCIRPGTVSDEPGILTDLFPTLAEAAGLDIPTDVEGKSLWPLLWGDRSPHDHLCWEFNGQRAVRRGRWKLVQPRPGKDGAQAKPELYDLETDPEERRNLAKEERYQVESLLALHDRWRKGWKR